MQERRSQARDEWEIAAKIELADPLAVEVALTNILPGGVRLRVADGLHLPSEFDLSSGPSTTSSINAGSGCLAPRRRCRRSVSKTFVMRDQTNCQGSCELPAGGDRKGCWRVRLSITGDAAMRGTKIQVGSAMAFWLFLGNSAGAVMGPETIMARVDKNQDKKLSLAEVRTAAADRYDLIERKNGGHVTMLQLGGRLVPADLKEIGKPSPGVESPVSKVEYLALAETFFDKADAARKAGDKPGSGALTLEELSSTAGKKLIGLLQ